MVSLKRKTFKICSSFKEQLLEFCKLILRYRNVINLPFNSYTAFYAHIRRCFLIHILPLQTLLLPPLLPLRCLYHFPHLHHHNLNFLRLNHQFLHLHQSQYHFNHYYSLLVVFLIMDL